MQGRIFTIHICVALFVSAKKAAASAQSEDTGLLQAAKIVNVANDIENSIDLEGFLSPQKNVFGLSLSLEIKTRFIII